MSRADEIFIANCKDILENGVWDTDLNVRPKWDDGLLSIRHTATGEIGKYYFKEVKHVINKHVL